MKIVVEATTPNDTDSTFFNVSILLSNGNSVPIGHVEADDKDVMWNAFVFGDQNDLAVLIGQYTTVRQGVSDIVRMNEWLHPVP